jgi:DNA-binding winged helix-turn-helix (wHTH) protein/Tfp pilus assembly protein PilF
MSKKGLHYEFENYVLLPSERLLMRDGRPVALKSKVFETLLTLVEHHGELLTKDELMTKIWGYNYVEEGNLTQNIFTLRKIFEERPKDHRFIVTVPGLGYRFVARVREIAEAKEEQTAAPPVKNGNGHVKSLAVLPLKFLTPKEAADKKYLGLAIADSLVTELSANRKISVRSSETVFRYADSDKDSVSIGRELGVDIVLSGTLQTWDEKIRANIQLHDTGTGATLWADKFEVRSEDFFELQDRISEQTAEALKQEIENHTAARRKTENPEIYQKYLKYRFFWETRTEEGLLTALNGAKEIAATAPDFPLGHIGIADSYLLLGHHLYLAPDKVYRGVAAAVEKALALDPLLAEAYASKADYCFITKNWAECERLHLRSIELKPDYASGRHWYSWFLMAMGRFDESLDQIEQAQKIDQNSLYLSTIRGVPLCYQRRFDLAVRQFELVLDINPNYRRAHYYLAWALFQAGDWERGIAELESVVANESIQQTIALLGYCYGLAGRREQAFAMLRRLDRLAAERYVSPYSRAMVFAGMDEKTEALNELEKCFAEDSIWLIWLKVDLRFINLSDEPRFKAMLARLNFPD